MAKELCLPYLQREKLKSECLPTTSDYKMTLQSEKNTRNSKIKKNKDRGTNGQVEQVRHSPMSKLKVKSKNQQGNMKKRNNVGGKMVVGSRNSPNIFVSYIYLYIMCICEYMYYPS